MSRFISAAIAGMSRLRKTAVSSRNESSTTTPMKSGSLLLSTRREVVEDRGLTADQDVQAAAARGGHDLVPQLMQEGGGRCVLRRAGRVDVGEWRRPACRRCRGSASAAVTRTTPLVCGDRRGDVRERRLLGGVVDLGDKLQRAVVAGAEALGEQVVGLARRAARGSEPGVGGARGASRRTGSRARASAAAAAPAMSAGRARSCAPSAPSPVTRRSSSAHPAPAGGVPCARARACRGSRAAPGSSVSAAITVRARRCLPRSRRRRGSSRRARTCRGARCRR